MEVEEVEVWDIKLSSTNQDFVPLSLMVPVNTVSQTQPTWIQTSNFHKSLSLLWPQ